MVFNLSLLYIFKKGLSVIPESILCPKCECANFIENDECIWCNFKFLNKKTYKKIQFLNILPQYNYSNLAEERTFSSLTKGNIIERTESIKGITKKIIDEENEIDVYSYFTTEEFKLKYRSEFRNRLINSIGKEKTEIFLSALVNQWFKKHINSKQIKELKFAIKEFLLDKESKNIFCLNSEFEYNCENFNKIDIEEILKINHT